MEKLTCKVCGGNLMINEDRSGSTCESCATKYTEETIKKMLVEISGGKVEVEGILTVDRLSSNGDKFIASKDWGRAFKTYQNMIMTFPHDYRGYWGMVHVYTKGLTGYFSMHAYRYYYQATDCASGEAKKNITTLFSEAEGRMKANISRLKATLKKRGSIEYYFDEHERFSAPMTEEDHNIIEFKSNDKLVEFRLQANLHRNASGEIEAEPYFDYIYSDRGRFYSDKDRVHRSHKLCKGNLHATIGMTSDIINDFPNYLRESHESDKSMYLAHRGWSIVTRNEDNPRTDRFELVFWLAYVSDDLSEIRLLSLGRRYLSLEEKKEHEKLEKISYQTRYDRLISVGNPLIIKEEAVPYKEWRNSLPFGERLLTKMFDKIVGAERLVDANDIEGNGYISEYLPITSVRRS